MPDSVSPVLSRKDLEFVTAEWFVLPTMKLQDEVKFWISTHYGHLTPSPPHTPRTLAPTLLCNLNSQAKVPWTDPSNEGHRVSSPVSLPLILWEGARGDGILVISVVRRPNQEEYKFYFTRSSPRGKKGDVTSSSDRNKNQLQTFPSHPTPKMYLRNHALCSLQLLPQLALWFAPILAESSCLCPDTEISSHWPIHIAEFIYLPCSCGWKTPQISLHIFFRHLSVDLPSHISKPRFFF